MSNDELLTTMEAVTWDIEALTKQPADDGTTLRQIEELQDYHGQLRDEALRRMSDKETIELLRAAIYVLTQYDDADPMPYRYVVGHEIADVERIWKECIWQACLEGYVHDAELASRFVLRTHGPRTQKDDEFRAKLLAVVKNDESDDHA